MFSRHILWLNYQVVLSHRRSESYIRELTQSFQSTLESKHPAERWGNTFGTLSDNDMNCHHSSPNVQYALLSKPGGISVAQLSSLSSVDIKWTSGASLCIFLKFNASILSQGIYRFVVVEDFFLIISLQYQVMIISLFAYKLFLFWDFFLQLHK